MPTAPTQESREKAADNRERWKVRLQFIQAIGTVVAVIALLFTYLQFRDYHEFNRRAKAMELLSRFNAEVGPHREEIVKAFPKINNADAHQAPSRAQCLQIVQATTAGEKIPGITDDALALQRHLNSVFNYFEDVAIGWDSSVADEKILDDSMTIPLLRWYETLSEYDQAVKDKYKGKSPRPSLDNYILHLKDVRDGKPKPRRPKTG
jgi:hypothetical protein